MNFLFSLFKHPFDPLKNSLWGSRMKLNVFIIVCMLLKCIKQYLYSSQQLFSWVLHGSVLFWVTSILVNPSLKTQFCMTSSDIIHTCSGSAGCPRNSTTYICKRIQPIAVSLGHPQEVQMLMEKNWEWEELPPQGQAQQLAVQCQTGNPESKHAGSSIWAERVILYACNNN